MLVITAQCNGEGRVMVVEEEAEGGDMLSGMTVLRWYEYGCAWWRRSRIEYQVEGQGKHKEGACLSIQGDGLPVIANL